MDKYVIELTANEQKMKKTSCDQFASHTVSYVEAHFILGDNWSGFDSVSAVWTNGWETIATVLDSDGICIVPHEVLERRAEVRVNLVGSVADGGTLVERLTTFPVVALDVTKRAYVSGTETAEVTPSQYEQFVANVKADADRAEDARDEAEGIKTEVEGLKADTEQIKTDTEAIKTETEAIKTATESLVNGFDDKVTEALDDISEAKTDALDGISTAKTDALIDIGSAKDQVVDDITEEGTRQVGLVTEEGQTQTEAVQTEGTTQVNAVRTEGGTQITNIEQRGADVLSRIPYFAPIITDTAEGSIASFTVGADDYPMNSVVAQIVPKQEGSGDPSPDNIRPISGWSGVEVKRTGANLCNLIETTRNNSGVIVKAYPDGRIVLNGTASASGWSTELSVPFTLPRGTYYFGAYVENAPEGSGGIATVGVGNAYVSPTTNGLSTIYSLILTEPTTKNINIQLRSGKVYNNTIIRYQISPTTFTEVSPMNSASKSIPFKDENGDPITVYGGNMNITDGEGNDGMRMVDLGTLRWSKRASGVFYTWDLQNLVKPVSNTSQVANAKCSALKLGAYNDVYNNATLDYAISVGPDSQLGAHCSAYAEAADFKTAMQGVQLVYELANPTPIYCEPTEIKSLKGSNNVWADTGDSNVEYCADTKLYIDKKLGTNTTSTRTLATMTAPTPTEPETDTEEGENR